jgi:hypothetical protein
VLLLLLVCCHGCRALLKLLRLVAEGWLHAACSRWRAVRAAAGGLRVPIAEQDVRNITKPQRNHLLLPRRALTCCCVGGRGAGCRRCHLLLVLLLCCRLRLHVLVVHLHLVLLLP